MQLFAEKTNLDFCFFFPVLSHMNGMIMCDLQNRGTHETEVIDQLKW